MQGGSARRRNRADGDARPGDDRGPRSGDGANKGRAGGRDQQGHPVDGGGVKNRRQKSRGATKRLGRNGGNGDREGAKQKHVPGKAAPLIERTNFRGNFHARLCRAARYKVHSPMCSCPKVVKLRQRHLDAGSQYPKEDSGKETLNGSPGKASRNTDSNGAKHHDKSRLDVDERITHRLDQLRITSNERDPGYDPFDNLIVVPDTKSTQAVYVCEGTDRQSFRRGGEPCERKMAGEIFGTAVERAECGRVTPREKVAASENDSGNDAIPFKVNCAICLLTAHQRNGFVAIVSQSAEELQPTICRARDAASNKLQQGGVHRLHSDHAHFVCAVRISSLQSLLSAGKTREKDRRANAEILVQMEDGGVLLPRASPDGCEASPLTVQMKMGHHLTSLLWLLQDPSALRHKNDDAGDDMKRHLRHIMVIGYVDGPGDMELDLPGGKRHLGESTLRGAIREMEEECSLRINRQWLAGRVPKRYGGDPEANRDSVGVVVARAGPAARSDGMVRVLEPRKIRGSESGDAFFVITPPPPS